MTSRTDVVYFGSGAFGIPTLAMLAERHRVRLVVTQPDRPAGRGKKLTPNPVAAWAAEHLPGTPVLKPERVNEPEIVAQIRETELGAWVVIAFGQKLGSSLLADRFAINLHASLLPRWRGAAPINHAILAGDAETGNSVITLADRMDAGLILGQSRRAIEPAMTAGDLHDLLAADGPDLVAGVLDRHAAGTLDSIEQDESLVTLAGKLSKADGAIDWSRPASEIACRINGLSPWPGAFADLGGERIRFLRAEGGGDPFGAPGRVLDGASGLIAAGSGCVRMHEVQPPNKPVMSWSDFANGRGWRSVTPETPDAPVFASSGGDAC